MLNITDDNMPPIQRRIYEAVLPVFDEEMKKLRDEKADIEQTREAVDYLANQLICEIVAITCPGEDKGRIFAELARFTMQLFHQPQLNLLIDPQEH